MGTVRYGADAYNYTLQRDDALSGEILIEFDRQGELRIRAPKSATTANIKSAAQRKARWIAKRQRTFEKARFAVTPREYVSGETFFYLGRRYVLKVVPRDTGQARLSGRHFIVEASNPEDAAITTQRWYRRRAKHYFERMTAEVVRELQWLEKSPKVQVKSMALRWGYCGSPEEIVLNTMLVRADRSMIEYVILHELCHILQPNHGSDFYELLSKSMPDWKARRAQLENISELVLSV